MPNEWNKGQSGIEKVTYLNFKLTDSNLNTVWQPRPKRWERGEAHCGAAGAETTILMLLVGVLVWVLKVQLLLSSVRPQDLALCVIWPRGLRRVTLGAKV